MITFVAFSTLRRDGEALGAGGELGELVNGDSAYDSNMYILHDFTQWSRTALPSNVFSQYSSQSAVRSGSAMACLEAPLATL